MGPNISGFNRFRSKSSNNNYYVANNYPTVPATEPKSKTKLLIIVVVSAVVLITIFAIVSSTRSAHKKANQEQLAEFYEALNDFNIEYTSLINAYGEKVGFVPSVKLEDGNISAFSATPNIFSLYFIAEEKLDNLTNKYNEKKSYLSNSQEQNYQSLVEIDKEKLDNIYDNLYILTGFYGATMTGIISDKAESFCRKENILTELVNSDNERISSSAKTYADYLCGLHEAINNSAEEDEFIEENSQKLERIIEDLNGGLKEIVIYDEDNDYYIDKILEER